MTEWFPPRRQLDSLLRDLPNPDRTLIGLAKTAYKLAQEAAKPVWYEVTDDMKASRLRYVNGCIARGEKPTFQELCHLFYNVKDPYIGYVD